MKSLILLVDDEPSIRKSLAQALEENGYRVVQATNGRDALRMLSGNGCEVPDLIVSDVMMPLLGGMELCEALKSNARTARVPVVLMSAVAQSVSVAAHGEAFIQKPFDLDALDVLIESILVRYDHSGGETMNLQANAEREATRVDAAHGLATLRFRHDQQNSGVSRHGLLHGGEWLRIEYDPARLAPADGHGKTMTDVVCHLRFQPSGEQQSRSLRPQAEPLHRAKSGARRPLLCQVQIPTEAKQVDVWFEGRVASETSGWDSRYGRNFTFPVTDLGLPVPEHSVDLRCNARVDATRIQVVEDAASKEQVALGASGSRLQTVLLVRAHVEEPSAGAAVWADLHVFDAMGELLHAVTIDLEPSTQAEAAGPLRLWDAEVYPGSGGASGMGVSSRPDAHTINYRLYCQIGDQVFSDGELHQFEVPADTEVRPVPGGW
jgi:DNA-binding response OmpR family regulator